MHKEPYNFDKRDVKCYQFVSKGKNGAITKVVEFILIDSRGIFNLGFGDLLANDKIDDLTVSNNGDIVKVFSTIMHIINDFLTDYPTAKIIFTGSTLRRTKLYQRILTTYFEVFKNKFVITALLEHEKGNLQEVAFDISNNLEYEAFFVKRR